MSAPTGRIASVAVIVNAMSGTDRWKSLATVGSRRMVARIIEAERAARIRRRTFMFNGSKVIDTDGHVMEPNDLYDRYLEDKFKPELQDLKKEAAARPSKFFFGIFHQLNTGR